MTGLVELGEPSLEEPRHWAVVRILPLFIELSRIFEEHLDVRPHQIRCRDDRLEQSGAGENGEIVNGLLSNRGASGYELGNAYRVRTASKR